MVQAENTRYQLAELFFRLLQNLATEPESEQEKLYQLATQSPQPSEIVLVTQIDGQVYVLLRTEVQVVPEIADPSRGLSPRELEIVHLIARGLPNKKIAAVLDISPFTVATHLRRIFYKLGVNTRAEMIARCLQDLGIKK